MQNLAQEKRTPLCGSATRTASPMPWPILANRKRSANGSQPCRGIPTKQLLEACAGSRGEQPSLDLTN
jgi:hypothetical protein